MFRNKNSILQLFRELWISHVFQITVIEINEATAKPATKTWLAKVAAIFIYRTRLTCNNARNTYKIASFSVICDFMSL